jgi:hypothetical protein
MGEGLKLVAAQCGGLVVKARGKTTYFTATGRIRSRTPKRAAQERAYRKRVKVWLKEHPTCQGCGGHSTQAHHSHGRVGRLLLYEPWWIAVCDFCHQDINEHPAQARMRGLICPVGQWNTPPPNL